VLLLGIGISVGNWLACDTLQAAAPNGALYHREPGCVDGVCVPNRATNGFYPTRWRAWPGTETGPAAKKTYPGINVPNLDVPGIEKELSLPKTSGTGTAAPGAAAPSTSDPATSPSTAPPNNSRPNPLIDLPPELRDITPPRPTERTSPTGALPKPTPLSKLELRFPDSESNSQMKVKAVSSQVETPPPSPPRSLTEPLRINDPLINSPSGSSPKQLMESLRSEQNKPAGKMPRPEDLIEQPNGRISLREPLRITTTQIEQSLGSAAFNAGRQPVPLPRAGSLPKVLSLPQGMEKASAHLPLPNNPAPSFKIKQVQNLEVLSDRPTNDHVKVASAPFQLQEPQVAEVPPIVAAPRVNPRSSNAVLPPRSGANSSLRGATSGNPLRGG